MAWGWGLGCRLLGVSHQSVSPKTSPSAQTHLHPPPLCFWHFLVPGPGCRSISRVSQLSFYPSPLTHPPSRTLAHTHSCLYFFSFHHRSVKTSFLASIRPWTGDWDPVAHSPVSTFTELSWRVHCEPASVLAQRIFSRV